MLAFNFAQKLKKLNKDIYIDTSYKRALTSKRFACGLFLRKKQGSKSVNYTNAPSFEAREWLQAGDDGHLDQHIGSVPTEYVPEHDEFDVEGRLIARGWRSIVSGLIKKGIVPREKARNLFSRSLGETDYDRASNTKRKEWAGIDTRDARQILRDKGFT